MDLLKKCLEKVLKKYSLKWFVSFFPVMYCRPFRFFDYPLEVNSMWSFCYFLSRPFWKRAKKPAGQVACFISTSTFHWNSEHRREIPLKRWKTQEMHLHYNFWDVPKKWWPEESECRGFWLHPKKNYPPVIWHSWLENEPFEDVFPIEHGDIVYSRHQSKGYMQFGVRIVRYACIEHGETPASYVSLPESRG